MPIHNYLDVNHQLLINDDQVRLTQELHRKGRSLLGSLTITYMWKQPQRESGIKKPKVVTEVLKILTSHADLDVVVDKLWKLVYRYYKLGEESCTQQTERPNPVPNPYHGAKFIIAPHKPRNRGRRGLLD